MDTNHLPCLPNLGSQDITWREPWTVPEVPRMQFPTKDSYKAYITHPKSESCLFSGVSGLNPHQRVSRHNPATRLHAVVADFDTILDESKRLKMLERLTIKPNFISRSYSGGTHAIWILEESLPLLPDSNAQRALLQVISKELKLTRAFGAIDENAFYNLSQLYNVGWEWQAGGGTPIAASRTILWLEAAMKKARSSEGEFSIPLERISAEIGKRFPNRWHGEFTLGARGCRFWDAQADCHTAAIVTENGMVCFTGTHPWRSWKDIFGEEFIKEFQQNTLGKALHDCYFINNKFYVKTDNKQHWMNLNRQNMESFLVSSYALNSRCEKGQNDSEVKQALGKIIHLKNLAGAVPLIYNPKEVIKLGNESYLNISTLRVFPPAADLSLGWGESFPWIASFLEKMFPDKIQRDRFICEWAYAYKNAYKGKPRNGRTIFIAGEPCVGKNFLTEVLIGPSLGGYSDASDYLLGVSRFNEHLFKTGVWVLNDTVSRGDWKERGHFTKMLKKMAANITHAVEGKFKDASIISWSGRVYITLNTDPISLSLLPEIDINNRDKLSLYRTSATVLNDPKAASKVREELPFFCAYLLHMNYPEHCKGDVRWGVMGYLHHELYEAAESSGQSAGFQEILSMFLNSVFAADKSLEEVSGSGAQIFSMLSTDEATKELVRSKFNPQWVAISLGMLKKRGNFPIEFKRSKSERRWKIKRTEWKAYLQKTNHQILDETMPF